MKQKPMALAGSVIIAIIAAAVEAIKLIVGAVKEKK